MPRKVFISFLGITKYFKARYYFEAEGKESAGNPEHFVQISLLKTLKDTLGQNDKAYIFLTLVAEEKNWNDKGNFDEGLYTRLKHLQESGIITCEIVPVHAIPEGFTSDEIWDLFQRVLKKIEPRDEVHLDITHAFRHIPMLALTIMNFAVAVKNIQLKAIYYGAFEKILNDYEKRTGDKIFASDVEKKIPEEERLAPILNLSTLEQLQQWSFAAQSFQKAGNAFFVSEMATQQTRPLLRDTEGMHPEAKRLSQLARVLSLVSAEIVTCRGKEIEKGGTVNKAAELINELRRSGSFVKPIEELLYTINTKLSQLLEQNYPRWFNAVKWCEQHRLIQQGITLLQEGIITHVIQIYHSGQALSWKSFNHREIAKVALIIKSKRLRCEDWKGIAPENEKIIAEIIALDKFDVLARAFDPITIKRNFINHGGYLEEDNTSSPDFEIALKEGIKKLEAEYFI